MAERTWRWNDVALGASLGLILGVGGFTFFYGKGASYFTNDPKACANCHIMWDHYAAWVKSTHRAVATCNDCHTPPGLVGKYVTKANNGFWHSYGFTTGWFPEPLRITPRNRAIAESACRKCHADVVHAIDAAPANGRELSCIRCHRDVGHPR